MCNSPFWFTGQQTALRSHQRSLQALQCSHAGADSKDTGNVGQLVGPDILRDRARQHRAVVDGVKADACFAAQLHRAVGARAATASGAWAGWAAPVSRSSLPSTVPKCFTARRFAQPGSGSSVVRSSSTGWRIKSVYFRVRRLYSRCNSFLVRSVYCIPFHSSFTCIDYYTRGSGLCKKYFLYIWYIKYT